MNWITRERPKIDRIACPWLIKRFIDKEANFFYVHFDEVKKSAVKLNAIPFDVPGVEFTHYADQCTFDYLIKKYKIVDPAIRKLAIIVRAADTDRHNLATQSSGLWAISAGLSHIITDDHELLEKGMLLYDALYAWAKYLQHEKHTKSPFEHLVIDIYKKCLNEKTTPVWARELKEMIQDQIDTNLSLNLTAISKSLQLHPSYLSREFSKYFDDLTFGEYIRKLRIEKAIDLLEHTKYSLSEIAYLTGFSDQSHFTRIFKKQIGIPPLSYRKSKKYQDEIKQGNLK
jgi:hypothetical protein